MKVNRNCTADHLARAIAQVGSMTALARQLGVTKGALHQWRMPGRRVPAQHCPVIERLTQGAVRCEELRPDVDWLVLRAQPPRRKPAASASASSKAQEVAKP